MTNSHQEHALSAGHDLHTPSLQEQDEREAKEWAAELTAAEKRRQNSTPAGQSALDNHAKEKSNE